MIYRVLLTSIIAVIIGLISVQPVLGQENNDQRIRPNVALRFGENSSDQVSPGPSASPIASSTASASPEVNTSPQPSNSPSPKASVSPSPKGGNGQGQPPSEGNIIVVTDPSPSPTPLSTPTPTPTPANFEQPITEPQLLTPLIVEDPSPKPSPSPSPPLAIQLTRRINPPDFGSLFDANHVQYYTKNGLPINLTISFLFLSLALTLSGVLALSETFSFRGLWKYIKNGQWRKERMSYYSMKKAVS